MGLGSQRAGLEQPDTAYTFRVRDVAPDILLFANLGAVQLNRGYGVDHCRRAVDMIGADALILHVNPLQEALQADGDWDWRGVLGKIETVCRGLGAPVVVKEVGWGINEQLAGRLVDAGVAAIDVAGAGGTSWSAVESYRAQTEARRQLCLAFADWGIPTAETLQMARRGAPNTPLIASGGLRTGIDAAKALALGASAVGIASPFLKAAALSTEAGGVHHRCLCRRVTHRDVLLRRRHGGGPARAGPDRVCGITRGTDEPGRAGCHLSVLGRSGDACPAHAATGATAPAVLQPDVGGHYAIMQYHMGWLSTDLEPAQAPSGKRVRPLLCLLACAAAGGDPAKAVPAAAGLELLHNFSLIHDDIEDVSPTRRHRPTAWAVFGMPRACNAGDGMFSLAHAAFQRLPEQGVSGGDCPERLAAVR